MDIALESNVTFKLPCVDAVASAADSAADALAGALTSDHATVNCALKLPVDAVTSNTNLSHWPICCGAFSITCTAAVTAAGNEHT